MFESNQTVDQNGTVLVVTLVCSFIVFVAFFLPEITRPKN